MTGWALQPRLTEKHRMGLYGKGKKKQRKAQTWVGRDEKVVKGVVVETDELKINFMKFSNN